MTFDEALKYLDTFVNYEQVMRYPYENAYKLQRMQKLCDLAGNPEKRLRAIHIGGTKGKGSVAAMTESILRAAGHKTGLYTSPDLGNVRERIRIAGELIPEDVFSRHVSAVRKLIGGHKANPRHGTYTYFEIFTLVAFLIFVEEEVDAAVLEVGLGGRLDATNVVVPLAVGLVPVSFEHASILGVTLERIANEKCGIIKEGVPVVSARQPEVVHGAIQKTAKSRQAPLLFVSKEIRVRRGNFDLGSQRISLSGPWKTRYEELELPLLGMHQAKNAALAVGLIETLKGKGFRVSSDHVGMGLKKVRWPGRFEIMGEKPIVVLDGAQNADSARALMEAIKDHCRFKKLLLILGISSDKDLEGVGRTICTRADEVIFTEADHVRSASANFLNTKLGKFCKRRRTVADVREALDAAGKLAGPDDLILVTGSLFLVGLARRILLGSEELQDVSVKRT